jgi:hypothetical protein
VRDPEVVTVEVVDANADAEHDGIVPRWETKRASEEARFVVFIPERLLFEVHARGNDVCLVAHAERLERSRKMLLRFGDGACLR